MALFWASKMKLLNPLFLFLLKKYLFLEVSSVRGIFHCGAQLLSSSGAWAPQMPQGMWESYFPDQGSNPHPLHWKADS